MKRLFAEITAVARSGRFTPYIQGVPVTLPTGETLTIKIEKTERSVRPVGLRFSEFAFVTEVSAGKHLGVGYGESSYHLPALQKSIAEGVERAVYLALKGTSYGSPNSNGWAAHLSRDKAHDAAADELLERDAILVHWLSQKPWTEIGRETWPSWLTNWTDTELQLSPLFNRLRILIATDGYLPALTTVLLSEDDHAVLSHATADSIDVALAKALAETCRIAQIAMENDSTETARNLGASFSSGAPGPEDHALYYAFHEKFPDWVFGHRLDWKTAKSQWRVNRRKFRKFSIQSRFHEIASGPLTVGYATSKQVQGLFFGGTTQAQATGLINSHRLRAAGYQGDLNLMPHCVP